MASLRTSIASIPLENCIYNASGPRTGSSAAMSKIAASSSGAVLAKSATVSAQTGNPQPRTWHSFKQDASMNSEGLPNAGIDYYLKAETISETMGDSGKPYMVSISGKSLEDNLAMLTNIFEQCKQGAKIAAVELNLACPNVIGKPIIAFDFVQMEQVLAAVSELYQTHNASLPLGIKMPPYFDMPHFEMAASILNKFQHVVKYVASINTVGNALAIDFHAEMPVIASKGGFAGLSGPAIKYTALANVNKMRQLLHDDIDVVGVGGIQSGKDAFEMILCGASAVQVGTCHWVEGPKCFDRISEELQQIMKEKGYSSIQDFKGKLKEWSKEGASASRAARKAAESSTEKENAMTTTKQETSNPNNSMISTALLGLVAVILLHDKFLSGSEPLDDTYFNTSFILLATCVFLLMR